MATWFLPSLLSSPAEAEVGGPPDASVVPPFEEDTFAPLVVLSVPSGSACTWLDDDAVSGVVGADVSSSASEEGCTWSRSLNRPTSSRRAGLPADELADIQIRPAAEFDVVDTMATVRALAPNPNVGLRTGREPS